MEKRERLTIQLDYFLLLLFLICFPIWPYYNVIFLILLLISYLKYHQKESKNIAFLTLISFIIGSLLFLVDFLLLKNFDISLILTNHIVIECYPIFIIISSFVYFFIKLLSKKKITLPNILLLAGNFILIIHLWGVFREFLLHPEYRLIIRKLNIMF